MRCDFCERTLEASELLEVPAEVMRFVVDRGFDPLKAADADGTDAAPQAEGSAEGDRRRRAILRDELDRSAEPWRLCAACGSALLKCILAVLPDEEELEESRPRVRVRGLREVDGSALVQLRRISRLHDGLQRRQAAASFPCMRPLLLGVAAAFLAAVLVGVFYGVVLAGMLRWDMARPPHGAALLAFAVCVAVVSFVAVYRRLHAGVQGALQDQQQALADAVATFAADHPKIVAQCFGDERLLLDREAVTDVLFDVDYELEE
jgi:hypothetical protein